MRFAGNNSYVRILSTLNRELLKPNSSVALHRHSNALVDILPPEADSSITMLSDAERPDVTYHDIGGNDIQKQEIREAVELPLSNPGLYAQVCSLAGSACLRTAAFSNERFDAYVRRGLCFKTT